MPYPAKQVTCLFLFPESIPMNGDHFIHLVNSSLSSDRTDLKVLVIKEYYCLSEISCNNPIDFFFYYYESRLQFTNCLLKIPNLCIIICSAERG